MRTPSQVLYYGVLSEHLLNSMNIDDEQLTPILVSFLDDSQSASEFKKLITEDVLKKELEDVVYGHYQFDKSYLIFLLIFLCDSEVKIQKIESLRNYSNIFSNQQTSSGLSFSEFCIVLGKYKPSSF